MSENGIYRIDFHSIKVGTDADFDSGIPADFFDRWAESGVAGVTAGKVHIHVVRHASTLELSVIIDATVILTCDRCLDEFPCPVHFEGHPVVKISDAIPDGERYSGDAHRAVNNSDGEVLWISPAENSLDMEQYIYESILLSLPFQRVHPDLKDCNPDMLRRFRIVSEEEFEDLTAAAAHRDAETAAEEDNPFAALAGLKDKNE